MQISTCHEAQVQPSSRSGQLDSLSRPHAQFVPHNLPTFSFSHAGTAATAVMRPDTLKTFYIGMSIHSDIEFCNDIESFYQPTTFTCVRIPEE
jgi:hypothetical protein